MKKWWLRQYGAIWHEWALILPDGYVVVYDETGQIVRRGSYGSRCRAIAALKIKGFRRLKRKEVMAASPPEVDGTTVGNNRFEGVSPNRSSP